MERERWLCFDVCPVLVQLVRVPLVLLVLLEVLGGCVRLAGSRCLCGRLVIVRITDARDQRRRSTSAAFFTPFVLMLASLLMVFWYCYHGWCGGGSSCPDVVNGHLGFGRVLIMNKRSIKWQPGCW